MNTEQEKRALFWCELLRPIIFGDVEPEGEHAFLAMLAQKPVTFPDGRTRAPSLSTLKRKLQRFRQDGFDALPRKRRADRGQPRSISQDAMARAVALKTEQPYRSDRVINRLLQHEYNITVPKTTLYRHLKQAGATRLKLGVCSKKVRKRWSCDHTHDLWVGDFAEGPYVKQGDQVHKTYLSAYIDAHSRFVVEARYYLNQNLQILADTLIRALSVHGAPRGLYLDNAKIYISQGLKSACYRCNIRLLHRPVGDPAPGGIIERFFQTVQNQFETEVRAGDILSLEELNQSLAAWMNVAYHQQLHSEIAQTPKKRCQAGRLATRFVDPASVIEGFWERVQRKVNPTFSDVQLHRRWFKVDPRYRGDRVMVHFDPFNDLETVEIYSLEGCYLCTAPRHQREQSEPAAITPPGKPQTSYLDLLNRQHQQQIDQRVQGIDDTQALKPWPFQAFCNAWARLAGRTLADFTPHELKLLQDFHSKNNWITREHLKPAFQKAPANTVAAILWQLEQHRKEVS